MIVHCALPVRCSAWLNTGGVADEQCMRLEGHYVWGKDRHKDVYGRRWDDLEIIDVQAMKMWKARVAAENWKPCRVTRGRCKLHG